MDTTNAAPMYTATAIPAAGVRHSLWRRAWSRWPVAGTLLFVWGFAINVSRGFGMRDESWFLQVVHLLAAAACRLQPAFPAPPAGMFRHPMPFDYPLVTAFGRHGATDVMVAIAEQRLRTVCLTPRASAEHTPLRLERYVEEHMLRGRDVGFCILYRR